MLKRNKNGEIKIDFAQRNNLNMVGTFYEKKKVRKWMWISPHGKVKNEVDQVFINNITIVKNVEVLSRFEFSSSLL